MTDPEKIESQEERRMEPVEAGDSANAAQSGLGSEKITPSEARKGSQTGRGENLHHLSAGAGGGLLQAAEGKAPGSGKTAVPERLRATAPVIAGSPWELRLALNFQILYGGNYPETAKWLERARPDWQVLPVDIAVWAMTDQHRAFVQRQKVGAVLEAQEQLEKLLAGYERIYGFNAGGGWKRQKALLTLAAVEVADRVKDKEGLMSCLERISAYLQKLAALARGREAAKGWSASNLQRCYTRYCWANVEDRTPALFLPRTGSCGRKRRARNATRAKEVVS